MRRSAGQPLLWPERCLRTQKRLRGFAAKAFLVLFVSYTPPRRLGQWPEMANTTTLVMKMNAIAPITHLTPT